MSTLLPFAQSYLDQGLSVIPLLGKRPAEKWEYYQSHRPTARQLKLWWSLYKTANVGVVTGKISNLVVIDFDHNAKLIYPRSFPILKRHLGDEFIISRTGKGFHCIIKANGVRNVKVAREGKKVLIETRGEGGYIVAPPSVHPEYGTVYEFTNCKRIGDIKQSDTTAVNDLIKALSIEFDKPEVVKPVTRAKQKQSGDVVIVSDRDVYVKKILKNEADRLANTTSGERNDVLYKVAAHLWSLSDYLDESAVYEALLTACSMNGLLKDDGGSAVMKTVKSAMRVDRQVIEEDIFSGMGLPEEL